MLTLDREDWAQRLRRLREHGMDLSAAARHASAGPTFESYLEIGFNYRMTDIQAAVGLVQLDKLDAMVERRRQLAASLLRAARRHPGAEPGARSGVRPQQLPVVLGAARSGAVPGRSRDGALHRLAAAGVSARRGIMASHLEPAYQGADHVPLPVTERLTRDSLILPLFHALTEAQQEHVVDVLRKPADDAA